MVLTVWLFSLLSTPCHAQQAEVDDEEQVNLQTQTQQGRIYAGVNYGFSLAFQNNRLTLNNSIVLLDVSVMPMVGYYIRPRIAIGGVYEYTVSSVVLDYKNSYKRYEHHMGAFGRYTLPKGLFTEAGLMLGGSQEQVAFEQSNNQEIQQNNKVYTRKVFVGLGIANYWSKRVSYELACRYGFSQSFNTRAGEGIKNHALSVSAGIGISIGEK